MASICLGVLTIWWQNIKKNTHLEIKEERREGRKEIRKKNKIKLFGWFQISERKKKKKVRQTTHQEEKLQDIKHNEKQWWKRQGILLETQDLPESTNAKQWGSQTFSTTCLSKHQLPDFSEETGPRE